MGTWADLELRSYPCDLCGTLQSEIAMVKCGKLIDKPFNIVKCVRCGHIRVDPRIPNERIPDLYDADYYVGGGFDETVDYRAQAKTDYRESPIVTQITATVLQLFDDAHKRKAIDIGCGLGDLVLGLHDAGFEAYGFDSSPYARQFIVDRGVPVIDLESDAADHEGSFDLITCVEVIEHVTGPRSFLGFLRSLLRPGGYLFVLTGNWHVQRLLRGTPYIMPEGHIHYFTPSSLGAFFRAVGFEIVQVPENHAWAVNRSLKIPAAVREIVQREVIRFARDLGPLPIARRPLSDESEAPRPV